MKDLVLLSIIMIVIYVANDAMYILHLIVLINIFPTDFVVEVRKSLYGISVQKCYILFKTNANFI